MSEQNRTTGSQGHEQQSTSASGGPGATHHTAPPSAGAQAAGPTSAAGRPDQERPMEVSREGHPAGVQPGESSGRQGMQQQGMPQGTQRGGSLSQPQTSILPAFFANPGLMASAFMASPFEFAEVMSREMDRIFENFGPGSAAVGPTASRQLGAGRAGALAPAQLGQQRLTRGGQRFTPQIELLQRGNELVVRADLPGVRPEDVQVEVEQGALVISGERRSEFEDQGQGFYRTERHYGSFQRAIPLPEGVNEDQIRATFNHGVLEIAIPLPQQPAQRTRRIQVQSASAGSVGSGQSAGQGAGQSSAGGALGSSAGQGAGGSSGAGATGSGASSARDAR